MPDRPKSEYVDEIVDAVGDDLDAPVEPVVDIGYHVLDGKGRCQLCGYTYPVQPPPRRGALVRGKCLVSRETYWKIKQNPKAFFK